MAANKSWRRKKPLKHKIRHVFTSVATVVDPNTLNLDPDPGFWLDLDQDPDLDPDLGYTINFEWNN